MENKRGSGARAGSLGGKGFYIVLFLCAAVIGVSAWMLLTDVRTNVEDEAAENEQVVDVSGAYVTMLPAADVPQVQTDTQVMATEETPAQPEESNEQPYTSQPETGNVQEQTDAQEEPTAQSVFSDGTVSYVWPVQGEVQRHYSVQTLLYDSTMADWRTHDGIDITSDQGTPVLAAADGLVVGVRSDDLLGTTVEIDHRNGIHSVYANLAAEPPVAAGDNVTMGQVIGSVGSTALGEVNQVSHLHFAMKQDGLTTDPGAYLPSDWTE